MTVDQLARGLAALAFTLAAGLAAASMLAEHRYQARRRRVVEALGRTGTIDP